MRKSFALLAIIAGLCGARRANAGGFELPDNGTEALGRGGAFVAKADDGTAIQYNVAGFARQKGTRLLLNSNFLFHDTAYTRSGVYPGDPSDSRTPYAGMPYPTIRDRDNLFVAPFLAFSTDLGGRLKHFVLAAGVYGPSSIGRHNFGVGAPAMGATEEPPATVRVNGMDLPAPSRYDVTKTDLLIVLPTLAVAWQPHPVIEVGLGWQAVIAHFDLANANLTTINPMVCPTPDYAGCDSYARIRATGSSFSSSSDVFRATGHEFGPGLNTFGWLFSLLLHPVDWLDIGATLRPQIDVHAEGSVHPISPPDLKVDLKDAPITFTTILPAFMRVGARAVKRYADGSERADVEVDLVWENWAAEQSDKIHAEDFTLGRGGQLDAEVVHNYRDTFGIRVGGAYNHRLNERMLLTGRLGAYADSAATAYKNTRLDFNTAVKYGLTVGAGFKISGFTFNLAYAFVYSPDRNVTDSNTFAISGTNGTRYQPGDAIIPVTNGLYQQSLHILSFGLTFNFSELLAKK